MANYGLLGGLAEHLQGQMRCQKICSDSQVKIFLLVGMCRPQPQHQGPKGVGHVPPGGLGEHLQGQMRYQKIYWDSQVKIFYWSGCAIHNLGTRNQKVQTMCQLEAWRGHTICLEPI